MFWGASRHIITITIPSTQTQAVCVAAGEPVLLVGETGCGKTTMIQVLAAQTGRRLVVQNLSLQTDGSDLIGGYRPGAWVLVGACPVMDKEKKRGGGLHDSPPHSTCQTQRHQRSPTVELAQSARRLYGEMLPAFEALFSRRKNARFLEVRYKNEMAD